jgi:hypothetical protein
MIWIKSGNICYQWETDMDIKPVKTEEDYQEALAKIEQLIEADPEVGSPWGNLLEILTTLVTAYEQQHYPVDDPRKIKWLKVSEHPPADRGRYLTWEPRREPGYNADIYTFYSEPDGSGWWSGGTDSQLAIPKEGSDLKTHITHYSPLPLLGPDV